MQGSNAPGWWFGIQTDDGNGALVQPILAWGYEGNVWSIFNGVYDWTDQSWNTVRPDRAAWDIMRVANRAACAVTQPACRRAEPGNLHRTAWRQDRFFDLAQRSVAARVHDAHQEHHRADQGNCLDVRPPHTKQRHAACSINM